MTNEDVVGQPVTPAEERMIDFYGDAIPVIRMGDGRLYVPLRPICDALNINFTPQRLRVLRDDVMAEEVVNVRVVLPVGIREMLAIPVEHLPVFLYGIEVKRLKVDEGSLELRDKLLRYKREVTLYIWQAFTNTELASLPAPAQAGTSGELATVERGLAQPEPPALTQLPTNVELTSAEQNLEHVAALYRLAASAVALERRTTQNEAGLAELAGKHQAMADYLRGFIVDTRQQFSGLRQRSDDQERRIGKVERGQVTTDPISNAQATQISQSVKRLADLIERRSGKRSFGMVYDTLYNRFEITTYKMLAKSDFEAAMEWLRQWYEEESGQLGR